MIGTIGKKFVAALVASADMKVLIEAGDVRPLFKADELDLFEFVVEHAKKFHALPNPDTIETHLGNGLPTVSEPPSYYLDLLQQRHIELELKRGMQEASQLLSVSNKQPREALTKMKEAVSALVMREQASMVADIRDSVEPMMADYKAKKIDDEDTGIKMGWPTLDEMTDGVGKGDLVSYVGRPAAGKTWQMLYSAHHAWEAQNKVPMFVSMEMNILQIRQRLTAMHSHVPISKIKTGELSSTYLDRFKKGLLGLAKAEVPLWIVDGNFTATVEDVALLAQQLQPDVIYIDGAYLLKHPKERDRFKRVAENADLIKQQLCGARPVVCSWQFSREASRKNKKKNESVTIDDIGYTDAIGQVSSLVLGLFQDDDVGTLDVRKVAVLKGRHGEIGGFQLHWDFERMDFKEVLDVPLDKLEFVN